MLIYNIGLLYNYNMGKFSIDLKYTSKILNNINNDKLKIYFMLY